MPDISIFCPSLSVRPPSSCRLPLWWSAAWPTLANGNGRTSVLLFLGLLLRAHADSPHCRALKADSDRIGSTSGSTVKSAALSGRGPAKAYRVTLGQKYREGRQMALFSATRCGSESKTHTMVHIGLAPLGGPWSLGAQGECETGIGSRSRSARELTDRRETAARSAFGCLPTLSAKRCTLSLARISRQRYLRADHNSTWRRATPPPQRSSCVQSRALPVRRYGMIHLHSRCLEWGQGTREEDEGLRRTMPPRNLPMLTGLRCCPSHT